MGYLFGALLAIVAFFSGVVAESRKIMFNRSVTPLEWTQVGIAHEKQNGAINIALQQQNLHVLEAEFWAVSNPKHEKYGKFLTNKEIQSIVAAPAGRRDQVVAWLNSAGISLDQIQSYEDAILVRAPIGLLNALLQTKFYNFVNEKGKIISRQMGDWSIPEEFGDIIQFISGVSDFPIPRRGVKSRSFGLIQQEFYVVPETINSVYNIAGCTASNVTSQAAAEFQSDASYNQADLTSFYKQMNITTAPISHIIGPYSGAFPDTEATLDVQYLTSIGIGANNWYWTEENWMYDFASSFARAEKIPDVVSISWGWSETAQCTIDKDCSTLGIDSRAYVNRTNVEFQKIGLRGTTLLASSGDSGANGRTGSCTDKILHPIFPAGSPYVTAVGATEIIKPKFNLKYAPPICAQYPCASGGVEAAVSFKLSRFTSGGGLGCGRITNSAATPTRSAAAPGRSAAKRSTVFR